ncbi:MAG: FAD-dependent oxidoreductase [Acidobacteriota bacterium]
MNPWEASFSVERQQRVVIVGSGLAGLSCAQALLAKGVAVTILTPGYLGRDGASQRVRALAPWILLNAPCQRGDSPDRFFADLQRAGQGMQRPGLAEVFAERAPQAAKELVELLDLEPLDDKPVLLPGNSYPRGRRLIPRGSGLLLRRLVAAVQPGAEVHERALAVGVEISEGRVVGVWAWHRPQGELRLHRGQAVVLACGGVGALFGPSTVPRWCRGSGLALGFLAQALLHNPHVTQALPVLAVPPVYFPTTAALLKSRIWVGEKLLPQLPDLESLSVQLAHELRRGQKAWLELDAADQNLLPRWIRESRPQEDGHRLPLTLAVHHGVGGVAVDTWGRTSVPGLYACGEAAGGVQGARRLMGTGLLEARIFGLRAAEAVFKDLLKLPLSPPSQTASRVLPPPTQPSQVEAFLDARLGALAVVRPPEEVTRCLEELEVWPLAAEMENGRAWIAAIRLAAARTLLSAQLSAFAREGEEVPRELAG